jgi:hypothetical protein
MTKLDYNHKNWKEFSKSVIEIDGYTCKRCGRTSGEVVLQVHHKRYVSGLKPWEYGYNDCETLCKGCHASIHGKILPKFGWEYCGDEDLGDLIGICENCSSSIRYQFTIHHINWGTIQVGSLCCDNLTDSTLASNLMESFTKYIGRKKRFLVSKRWKVEGNNHKIKLGDFNVNIIKKDEFYVINIQGLEGKKIYQTIYEAKSKVFDIVENGVLITYFQNRLKNK